MRNYIANASVYHSSETEAGERTREKERERGSGVRETVGAARRSGKVEGGEGRITMRGYKRRRISV